MKRKKKETKDNGKIKKVLKAAKAVGKTSAMMAMGLLLNGIMPTLSHSQNTSTMTQDELIKFIDKQEEDSDRDRVYSEKDKAGKTHADDRVEKQHVITSG